MGFKHRAASPGSGRRADSPKRKRQRVRIVFESEHQSEDPIATHFFAAGTAVRVATNVSRTRDVDLVLDRQRPATGRAAFLQDCGDGRIGDRGKNWKETSL